MVLLFDIQQPQLETLPAWTKIKRPDLLVMFHCESECITLPGRE